MLERLSRIDLSATKYMTAQRIIRRFLAAKTPAEELKEVLQKIQRVQDSLSTWQNQGVVALRKAAKTAVGLPKGWIWQDDIEAFMLKYEGFEQALSTLADSLITVRAMSEGDVSVSASEATAATDPSTMDATLNEAIKDLQFFNHPQTNRDAIAYSVETVSDWLKRFDAWVGHSKALLKQLLAKLK